MEFEDSSLVDLLSIKPERLSVPELRVLVSELSLRSVDVSSLTRAELLEMRESLLRLKNQPQIDQPKTPQQANSQIQGIQHDMLATESTELIDPSAFPDVNWKNLSQSTHAVGGFSCVVFSTYKGRAVALKVFKLPPSKESMANHWKEVRKEICILQEVAKGHPNLCSIVGLTRNPLNDTPVIIMWKMECELRSFLRSHPDLPFERRLAMVYEVALALLWMHDRASPVLHLDLKLENLMLDDKGRVVVCDFGLSLVMPQGRRIRIPASLTRAKKGNVSHRAPELCALQEDIHFGPPVDVYSLGICAWEILTGLEWGTAEVKRELVAQGAFERAAATKTPVADLQRFFIDNVVNHSFRPPIRPDWPAAFAELLHHSWDANPENRPSIKFIVDQLSPGGPIAAAFRAKETELQHQHAVNYIKERLAPDSIASAIANVAFRASPVVEWRTFVQLFWQHFQPYFRQCGGVLQPSDVSLLELALGVGETSFPGKAVVHFENFAKCVDAFRPLDAQFFDRIREVIDKPYVHLHWDAETTRAHLHGTSEGTFDVRYSDKTGAAFTVTKILGDRRKTGGFQACVRHRVYREEEVIEDGVPRFAYRLGHRDFARERFSSFSDIFDDPVLAQQLRFLSPVNREWISPLARLSLPPCADSGMSAPSAQPPQWEGASSPPKPNPYFYLPETLFDHSEQDTQRVVRSKLLAKTPMSPDRSPDR